MRLNSIVPNFTAESTIGKISLYEYMGNSWCVLFSHPGDFTPVCTTELGRLAVHQQHFAKRNVKLLAHSCDPVEQHKTWVADIKSYCLDIPGEFPYPIIGDESRNLAVQLGMLDESQKDNLSTAETVRALYIIDPEKRVKLSMHYPESTGRNVDEILRVIDSLQLTSKNKNIVTPANWVPGEKVMVRPKVPREDFPKLFPKGVEEVKMPSGVTYIRTTLDY